MTACPAFSCCDESKRHVIPSSCNSSSTTTTNSSVPQRDSAKVGPRSKGYVTQSKPAFAPDRARVACARTCGGVVGSGGAGGAGRRACRQGGARRSHSLRVSIFIALSRSIFLSRYLIHPLINSRSQSLARAQSLSQTNLITTNRLRPQGKPLFTWMEPERAHHRSESVSSHVESPLGHRRSQCNFVCACVFLT